MRVRSKAILAQLPSSRRWRCRPAASWAIFRHGRRSRTPTRSIRRRTTAKPRRKYEEVDRSRLRHRPEAGALPISTSANSYDNLYKPARKGEADNDALLTKAIENYKIAAERETRPDIKKLALEYLVNAYGPDKLDDPTQAEPIVQQMIQLDPSDTDELLRAREDLRGCRQHRRG